MKAKELAPPLALASTACVGLFLVSAIDRHNYHDWYLVWNLVLAWLPVGFAAWLVTVLPHWRWLSWRPFSLTILWLLFLPNSFYLVSDLVHLQEATPVGLLLKSVTYEAFILTGLLLGFCSLYLVHQELLKRVTPRASAWLIGIALLVCSFAIYLGRDLRWNSWDVLLSPAGMLFDISETFIEPRLHLDAFTTTLTFFVFLAAFYFVGLRLLDRKFKIRS